MLMTMAVMSDVSNGLAVKAPSLRTDIRGVMLADALNAC